MTMERTLEQEITEGWLTGELTRDDGTGP